MTDHQRADTVLPEHPCVTPNMDIFTAEGLIFDNTFCPSPHCCQARATFMTGLYPSRHSVWNNICNDQALSRGLNDEKWGRYPLSHAGMPLGIRATLWLIP